MKDKRNYLPRKMSEKKLRIAKKIVTCCLVAALVSVQSPIVYGQTAPASPEAPASPSVPENTNEEPNSPAIPEYSDEIPDAPDAPETPTPEDLLSEEESQPDIQDDQEQQQPGDLEDTDSLQEDEQSMQDGSGEETTSQDITGYSTNGQVGDVGIDTGDATNIVLVATDVNDNVSVGPAALTQDGGIRVVNEENGEGSENSGSATIVDNNTTLQDNSATVVNNLDQTTTTGDNSASENVGNSQISTGDANTSGAVINTVNTNIDGVMIAEFDVVDDHMGDVVLDFAEGCVWGCTGLDILAGNLGNGADSTNTSEIDLITENNTFQNNDATIENNATLTSDSGNNIADKNTGGDTEVTTGDANVSANVLNFANNNLAGNVIYSVVNIFGDLIGNIIFPEGTCCFGNTTAVNSGNGSGSTNTTLIDQTINDNTFQFNDVNIENNLVFDANTGANATSKNTGGGSSIETGDASVEAQIVNITNSNISGGDWWLVIVNEAGSWIGRIFGGQEGGYVAGSDGFEFDVDENGEITVGNIGNGSGSINTATLDQEINQTSVQTNTADIVNNINLTANTGGNSASRNTNGDSSITTGDANIIANIVNFVNNNIAGTSRLFVSVVNVFGSWIGDFVFPGYGGAPDVLADSNTGSGGEDAQENDLGQTPGLSEDQPEIGASGEDDGSASNNSLPDEVGPSPTPSFSFGNLLASATFDNYSVGESSGEISFLDNRSDFETEAAGVKTININLAWFVLLIPAYFAVRLFRKRVLAKLHAAESI